MIDTDKRFLKNAAKYVISAIISILVISYIIYHVVNSFGSAVETQPARLVTVRETLGGNGYLFKNEIIVSSKTTGGVNYLYENGQLVQANVPIADIYAGTDTESIKSEMSAIDNKIAILEGSSITGGTVFTDTASIDRSISSLYYSMLLKINNGEIDYAFRRSDDLLILLNKRQIVKETVADFSAKIAELRSQRSALASSLVSKSETVNSECSGYFFSEADGYENIFASSEVDTMSVGSFDELTGRQPEHTIIGSSNVIGKIMKDYTWYMAVKLNSADTAGFVENNTYTVVFPYSSDTEISMRLHRIITEPDSNDVVLVFATGNVPEGFGFLRMQAVEIVKKTYTGYRVPVSAVRIVDGAQGVYILDGNVVKFRRIEPLVEISGDLIVKEQDKLGDEDYRSKLGFYDRIIVEGKNLYERKIIG